MAELLTLISICVVDWVVAGRAMAYTTTRVPGVDCSCGKKYAWGPVSPTWHPFYEKKALGTDYFHIVGWIRYPALAWFAWLGYGSPFVGWSVEWQGFLPITTIPFAAWMFAATALVNALGWGVLKVVHGKSRQWGLAPRWLKQLMGRS